MSFAGDLHTFDLFDLLGWLMGRKKAGVLQMTRRSTKKRLAFRDGAVQWTSSNDPRETIGQALVRDGPRSPRRRSSGPSSSRRPTSAAWASCSSPTGT